MKHAKRLAALAAAGCMLAVAVGSASANNLSVTPSNEGFRITWPGLELSAAGGGAETECEVILEGTLHSETISKAARELIGNITRAIVTEGSCDGFAEDAIPQTETLPWNVRYRSFTGALPDIESVRVLINGVVFQLSILGGLVTCEYEGDPEGDLLREEGAVVTTADAEPEPDVERIGGSGLCPAEGEFDGNGGVTTLDGDPLFLRLI